MVMERNRSEPGNKDRGAAHTGEEGGSEEA